LKRILLKIGITAGVALPLSLTAQNPATALDFSFSFNNALNGSGSVTGVIRGLEEGTGAADSVEVLSNTLGFGLGEYVGNPGNNTWTVLSGEITAFNFLSFGVRNTSPAVTGSTLFFGSRELNGATFRAGLSNSPSSVTIGNSGVTTQDIALTFTRISDPTPIPTPALLPGLVGMGIAALRKRKAEQKEAVDV
jgi:hypothetical protein